MNRQSACYRKPIATKRFPGNKIALLVCLGFALAFASCGDKQTTNTATGGNTSQSPLSSSETTTVSGDCANAFYPVSSTIRRTYTVTYLTGSLKPASYTESFAEITPQSFKLVTALADGLTVTHAWKCAGEGLAALDYAQLNFGNQNQAGMKMDMDTVSAQGVMVPAESNWRVGYKWKTVFDISGRMEGAGAMPSGDMKATVTLDHEIVSEEPVTVPAGTFTAFKVQTKLGQTGTMQMTGRGGPSAMTLPLNTSLDMTAYHARGVGLVKSVIDKTATTELTSLTQ